jgi:O-antigen/teichoic acid export membrane protein
MFQQIKRLGTETAIYGISTIIGRFFNFLLVPFYTNVLAPGDYGIVAYVYSLIAFINVIYSYGMESSYFKYSSTLEIGTAKQNFSTPFISLFGTSVIFSIVLAFLASPIARMINVPIDYESILLYTVGILAFDAIAIIPFAALRMEHKAKLFATIKFLNIVVNVGMNLILLLVFRMGVIGVFISGLAASVLTVVMLLPTIFRYLTKEFNLPLWKALMKFGLPYIPSGIAAMAIQVIDRPILRALTDDATVGIYQANYRLGIFMMLIVSMYDYAWRPFYFSTAKEANAKEIFARVLTYLVLFMSAIFLVLTFFIGDIAKISIFGRHIIGQSYWGGLNIVPVVLLGYLFLGISTNLSAGIFIEKKTKYSPLVTGVGAVVNVAANFLLIPPFGMLGAAWATFIAYFAMALTMYFVVQRIYLVSYEFSRLFKVAGSLAVVIALYNFIPIEKLSDSITIVFLWKIFLIVLFLLLMYVMKFFKQGEISVIKRLWKRRDEKGVGDISDSI